MSSTYFQETGRTSSRENLILLTYAAPTQQGFCSSGTATAARSNTHKNISEITENYFIPQNTLPLGKKLSETKEQNTGKYAILQVQLLIVADKNFSTRWNKDVFLKNIYTYVLNIFNYEEVSIHMGVWSTGVNVCDSLTPLK